MLHQDFRLKNLMMKPKSPYRIYIFRNKLNNIVYYGHGRDAYEASRGLIEILNHKKTSRSTLFSIKRFERLLEAGLVRPGRFNGLVKENWTVSLFLTGVSVSDYLTILHELQEVSGGDVFILNRPNPNKKSSTVPIIKGLKEEP